MQIAIDPHDSKTAYADLRDDEPLTDKLRVRAVERAREFGADQVEFWRPPYGLGADRMGGFVELVRVRRDATVDSAVAARLCTDYGWERASRGTR